MINAIRAALADLDGLEVFDSDATEATQPYYVLVIAPAIDRSGEDPVAGGGAVDAIVRAVGVDPAHARTILAATRERLRNLQTVSNGYRWSFYWDGSPRPVQVERVVRAVETDTNYCWIDDEYTVFVERIST